MKLIKILFLFCLLLSMAAAVNAAITSNILSPSSGWFNTYSIVLNVTTNDNANVTFNTTANAAETSLFTNATQGNLTLNSTYLNEGNNTIYIFATNATNSSDTDNSQSVANVAVDVSAPTWDQALQNQNVDYDSAFSYDTNATDAGIGIDSYSVNDTTSFAIDTK